MRFVLLAVETDIFVIERGESYIIYFALNSDSNFLFLYIFKTTKGYKEVKKMNLNLNVKVSYVIDWNHYTLFSSMCY